jgi:DNA-binding transcriptional LysR family regulator
MDIHQLELLLAVIDSEGVTRAAKKLNVTAGAVSMQIRKLSADLGAELFVRVGRRLEPTPTALRFAQRARALVTQMQHLQNDFKDNPLTDARPFHLASTAVTLANRLGLVLREFRQVYPNCDLRVSVGVTEEIVTGLLERRFDLGLVSLPISSDKVTVMPLFQEELFLLQPSHTRVRSDVVTPVRPEELKDVPFLLYPRQSHVGRMIGDFLRGMGLSPRVLVESSDTEVLKRLVESGLGCAVIPEQALQKEARFFHVHRIGQERLVRTQALLMANTEFPRGLTLSIANFLQAAIQAQTM